LKTLFKPHPGAQTLALQVDDNVKFIGFGGARGGGKTMCGIAWLLRRMAEPNSTGLVIRRNYQDLKDWIDTARQMMPNATVTGKPAVFTFKNGSKFYCGHLNSPSAYEQYQGFNLDSLLCEELTQIPDLESFLKLCSSVRSSGKRPSQVFCSMNPGNQGHNFVKTFFKIGEKKPNVAFKDDITGDYRIYIPSKLTDNPTLMENDPGYYKYLDGLPEPLRSAWLEGDWDCLVGNYFTDWNPGVHIISEDKAKELGFNLEDGNNYCGIDVGFASPSVCEFINVAYNGNCFVFDEVWGIEKHPYEFGKMIKDARGNIEIEAEFIDPSSAIRNPQSWRNETTQAYSDNSMATAMRGDFDNPNLVNMLYANNSRVSGWRSMAQKMHYTKDRKPTLYVIEGKAPKLCETIPEMMRDEKNPDDILKNSRDHFCDALRYGLTNVLHPEIPTEVLTEEQKLIKKILSPKDKGGWTYEWKN